MVVNPCSVAFKCVNTGLLTVNQLVLIPLGLYLWIYLLIPSKRLMFFDDLRKTILQSRNSTDIIVTIIRK